MSSIDFRFDEIELFERYQGKDRSHGFGSLASGYAEITFGAEDWHVSEIRLESDEILLGSITPPKYVHRTLHWLSLEHEFVERALLREHEKCIEDAVKEARADLRIAAE